MVGRKNVCISPWWAAMLPTLRTTGLEERFSTFWASSPGKRKLQFTVQKKISTLRFLLSNLCFNTQKHQMNIGFA